MSASEVATTVGERCTMVTSAAPCSTRSAAMSCAELLAPSTTQCCPRQASPPSNWLECTIRPLNSSAPGMSGMLG